MKKELTVGIITGVIVALVVGIGSQFFIKVETVFDKNQLIKVAEKIKGNKNFKKELLKLFKEDPEFRGADGFAYFLRNTNGRLEKANTDTEYISPNQHGGIYGTIYRMYWKGDRTSGNVIVENVAGIIGGWIRSHDNSNRYVDAARYHDGKNHTWYRLSKKSGNGDITLQKSGAFFLMNGWVDYIK